MMPSLIRKLELGVDLSRQESESAMEEILSGRSDEESIVALLAALRAKGETVGELVGFARAMRRHVIPVFPDGTRPNELLVDTCGTGGDSSGTFNISTAAAFVAAGAGVRVAKHGNRSISSKCGSPTCSRPSAFASIFRRSESEHPFARSASDFCLRQRCTPPCATLCPRGAASDAPRSTCSAR